MQQNTNRAAYIIVIWVQTSNKTFFNHTLETFAAPMRETER